MGSDLVERLESSAKAFREHTVYDSEGDPLRLIVQAEEMDEAAARIRTLEAALKPFADIVPSSFYAADGIEAEGYIVILREGYDKPAEFTGADLARARKALGGDNG